MFICTDMRFNLGQLPDCTNAMFVIALTEHEPLYVSTATASVHALKSNRGEGGHVPVDE